MASIQEILKMQVLGWNDTVHRASRCALPVCASCQLSQQHRRPLATIDSAIRSHTFLREDHVLPGQRALVDLFEVRNIGRDLEMGRR